MKQKRQEELSVPPFCIWTGHFVCESSKQGGKVDHFAFTVARTHLDAYATIEGGIMGLIETEGSLLDGDTGALRPIDPKEYGLSPGQVSRLLRQMGYQFFVPVQYLDEDDIDELVHRCMTFKEKK